MNVHVFSPTFLGCLSTVMLAGLAHAHHGGGSYWENRTVGPLSGTATAFAFTFPHVSFALDIPDAQGNPVNHRMSIRWTPTVLRKMGWTRRSIEPGDKLTVTFVPHKQDPTVGSLLSLEVNDVPMDIDSPEDANAEYRVQ